MNKVFKRNLSVAILSASLMFGLSNVEAASPFSDLSESHGSYQDAISLYNQGIIVGFPDGTYGPNKQLTRAQGAILIGRALNLSLDNIETHQFKDVNKKTSGYEYIQALTNMGVFAKADKFNPEQPLTRAQMAKVINKSFQLQGKSNRVFRDVSKSHWAFNDIQTLVSTEVTVGTSNSTFNPNKPVTRIQMAAFINRAMDYLENPSKDSKLKNGINVIENNIYEPEEFSYEIEGDSLVLYFNNINSDLQYNYVNICVYDNPNIKGYDCSNKVYYYSEMLYKKNKVKLPLRSARGNNFTITVASKSSITGENKALANINVIHKNEDFLSSSFLVNIEHDYVQKLLNGRFKNHDNWSTERKIREAHNYIVKNYKYDDALFERLPELDYNYPDFDKMQKSKIGICYDLAALNTALLRGMGVPAKLEVGYVGDVFHAWTSVTINGNKKVIDPTWTLNSVKDVYVNPSLYNKDIRYVY